MTAEDEIAPTVRTPERALRTEQERLLAEDVRWFMGSQVAGWFGQLAFDEAAYREIAAAGARGGRYAENFSDRTIRAFNTVQLVLFGDPVDIAAEADQLKAMHRIVHGTGVGSFADTRYSAMNPGAWKWVLVSMVNMYYQAYVHTLGRKLDEDGREVVFRTVRSTMEILELPGRGTKLPVTMAELTEYYNDIAEAKLADNEFLRFANRKFHRLPVPTLLIPSVLRPLLAPFWRALTPVVTRPVAICSAGAAHPKMREILWPEWTQRHRCEFALYTAVGAFVWRRFPRSVTMLPMAYTRFRYERLRTQYKSVQLDSFAPLD